MGINPDRRRRASTVAVSVLTTLALGIGISVATVPAAWDIADLGLNAATTQVEHVADDIAATVTGQDRVRVVVIGDSYTGGSRYGGYGRRNWSELAARQIGDQLPVDLERVATGGVGYVQGSATFLQMARDAVTADADVVVFLGSRNDRAHPGVGDAARAAYTHVRTTAPGATLVVAGPVWVDAQVPAEVLAQRDEIRTAAEEAGAVWIDPLADGWFLGDEPGLISVDGVHPTDAGQRHIADRMLPPLLAAVAGAG